MKNIVLNLAGATCIVSYSTNFRRLYLYDPQWKIGFPITQSKPLVLDCGRILYPKELVLTIKHKLGII